MPYFLKLPLAFQAVLDGDLVETGAQTIYSLAATHSGDITHGMLSKSNESENRYIDLDHYQTPRHSDSKIFFRCTHYQVNNRIVNSVRCFQQNI